MAGRAAQAESTCLARVEALSSTPSTAKKEERKGGKKGRKKGREGGWEERKGRES
jgi:hypothetical protein